MSEAAGTDTYVRLRSKSDGEWFVDPGLRDRIVADAEAQGTNLTDVILQILSRHFNVPYESTPRTSRPYGDSDVLLFRMPPVLERVIAASYPRKRMDGIRYALCAHYGLTVPERKKRTRAARRRPDTAPAAA